MLNKEQQFRRRWLLTSGLGIPLGLALGQTIGFNMGVATGISKIWAIGFLFIGPGIAGIVVGVLQWLVLKGQISTAYRWIVATSFSWIVGHAVMVLMGNAVYGVVNLALWRTANLAIVWVVSGAISGAVSGAVSGSLVGLVQWWVMQRVMRVHNLTPQRWILASSLGWAIGQAIIGIVNFTADGMMAVTLSWVIYGLVYGGVTSQSISLLTRRDVGKTLNIE